MVIKLPFYVKAVVIILGLFLVFYILSIARHVFIVLSISMLLAVLLLPINKRLERLRFPRSVAIIISLLVVTLFIFLFVFFIYNQIKIFTQDMGMIEARLLELIDKLSGYIEKHYGIAKAKNTAWLKEHIISGLKKSSTLLGAILPYATSTITVLGLLPVFTFFMLYYRDFYKEFILKLFHSDTHNQVLLVLEKTEAILQNYLIGILIVTSIISTLHSVGLLLYGVKYAIFFGIMAGIFNLIPYVGGLLGFAMPTLYTYITEGSVLKAGGIMLMMWTIQFVEGHFITPNVVGSKVSLNPFAAIVALIIGGHLWGPVGMILFIPFTAVLKVIFDSIEPLKPYGFLLGNPAKEKSKNTP